MEPWSTQAAIALNKFSVSNKRNFVLKNIECRLHTIKNLPNCLLGFDTLVYKFAELVVFCVWILCFESDSPINSELELRVSWICKSSIRYSERLSPHRLFKNSSSVFVNLLRSPGIDSQSGGPVPQSYLSYRPARIQRLAESILVSLNVYKYGLSIFKEPRNRFQEYRQPM